MIGCPFRTLQIYQTTRATQKDRDEQDKDGEEKVWLKRQILGKPRIVQIYTENKHSAAFLENQESEDQMVDEEYDEESEVHDESCTKRPARSTPTKQVNNQAV